MKIVRIFGEEAWRPDLRLPKIHERLCRFEPRFQLASYLVSDAAEAGHHFHIASFQGRRIVKRHEMAIEHAWKDPGAFTVRARANDDEVLDAHFSEILRHILGRCSDISMPASFITCTAKG
jgi:hypothetical protein